LLKFFPAPRSICTFHRSLLRWYHHRGRDLPWRRTRDPYAILVSEFMLQQTQVATVIPYYNEWLRHFPDFASLAHASENDVLHAWQGLGYYTRARNLHATARAVVDRHRGRFPRSLEQMQQLPGIGKYTAHAVASFAFDQSVPIVESNTARVLTRLFDFRQSIDSHAGWETLWRYSAKLLPKRNAGIYNSAFMDLGALVCVPREPKCGICPVKRFCSAKNPGVLPIKKERPPTRWLIENHVFVVRSNKILLQKVDSRWRGMWVLPRVQTRPLNRSPIYKSVFPFTNHRVRLNVYAVRVRKIDKHSQRWIRIDSLDSVPIPSPHKRAMRDLLSARQAARPRRQQSSES
jgi:A/G-specific adenine glycosylase